ncbi:hypothetical protein Hanom_Chr12g01163251 [Helianthus anomalus]
MKSIKSGCEWKREKMLLLVCIFEKTLFTPYNFLIYFESDSEWRRERKDNNKDIKIYYLIEKRRKNIVYFIVI